MFEICIRKFSIGNRTIMPNEKKIGFLRNIKGGEEYIRIFVLCQIGPMT